MEPAITGWCSRYRIGLPRDGPEWYLEGDLKQQDALQARAETTCETASAEQRLVLAEIADDEWFQRGLVLASPDLYADLVKWLAAGPATRPGEALEASLATYLSRAAAKTTPYSTFTSLAEGPLDACRCPAGALCRFLVAPQRARGDRSQSQ